MPNAISPDMLVTRIAESRWGLISHAQARDAGLSPKQIQLRCRTGRWQRASGFATPATIVSLIDNVSKP
jgi:hypothetical protein